MTEPAIIALPPTPARIHFVGIGGIGMSGLARILQAGGYVVTGSDAHVSDQTEALLAEGVAVTVGHADTEHAARADLVVITAAVGEGNPEVAAARERGIPVSKRAALLGAIANPRVCVAVAGSHGKSTTSGMLVTALQELGADPSYAVGAVVASTGVNAAPGAGACMVVEADEYDYSFLQLTPDVAIVTNIDYDHPDLFPDTDAYERAFAEFAARLKSGGTLILAADDPASARLRERVTGRVVTFGETDQADLRLSGEPPDYRISMHGGDEVTLRLRVAGRHNARNATAALAALIALGHNPGRAVRALESYRGVGRRFELVGEQDGIVVVDDYAHHPSEIRATIAAARERFPDRRLVAAFQPHTYSRTKALLEAFAAALSEADLPAVLDIYAAREHDDLAVSSRDLVALIPPPAFAAGTVDGAAERLAEVVQAGDVVLTLGAGDVTALGPKLLARLARKGAATVV